MLYIKCSRLLSCLALFNPCRTMTIHVKCRNTLYPRSSVQRLDVPPEKIPWAFDWPQYDPPAFTMLGMKYKPWADPDIGDSGFCPKWNTLDGNINRCSYNGPYLIINSFPLNPVGRTGLKGRGYLGRWGPNHAADPIVTRWKHNSDMTVVHNEESGKPILQFISIERKDCGEWAIPGGMVDPGELVSETLRREFCEEALNSLAHSEKDKSILEHDIQKFFNTGKEIYKGYVDDPRNTDNAWIETVAYNFHDYNGIMKTFNLQAGDDAAKVHWTDISQNLKLYASHSEFIKIVVNYHNAHW